MTAFYCMSSDIYFLGAVAMINSLRLVGHEEPVHVLDLGMRPKQRAMVEPHVNVVELEGDTQPWLSKTVAPLAHPDDVMVLIDADMIVTRSLADLIERARSGEVIAVEHGQDRHVPEWGEILDLGPVRKQTYVCSGFLATPRDPGEDVLRLMADRQDRIDFDRTSVAGYDTDYELLFLDQDVLNAVLASKVEAERVVVLDRRLEAIPPFEGLRVVDEETLRCAYEDGTEPYLIHHFSAKPWLELTPHGVYTQLLRRLLIGDDVVIQVPDEELPLHLRPGLIAKARHTGNRVGGRIRGALSRQ